MPDDNTPAKGTVEDTSVMDELADALDDPDEDTDTDETQSDQADSDDSEEEPEEDEEEADDSEEDDADQEKGDKPADYSKGRFAADDAKVKLPDGTMVTVAELKKGTLRQSDYTRKMQDMAEQRKAFEADRQRVNEVTQQLQEAHARASWWLEQTKPKRPEVSYSEDPLAHGEYRDALERHAEAEKYFEAERQKATAALQEQQQEQFRGYLKSERDALISALPVLRDDSKREQFTAEAVKFVKRFGYSEQDVRSITDHRLLLILAHAMKNQRAQERAPKVRKDLEGKPRLLTGAKRSDTKGNAQHIRKGKIERLRNEGTFAAGVAALMDDDL